MSEGGSSEPQADTQQKTEPGPGNGGVGPSYTWTQTLGEVVIVVPVDKDVVVKEISLETNQGADKNNSGQLLRFGLRNQPPLIDGPLFASISDTCWQLDRSDGTVEITLEKSQSNDWWPCVIKGHPEIDLSKIIPQDSRLEELDSETRTMVEKMRYDQEMKARGLPTSDEAKKQAMLEKFQAQHPELDFSNAKIQ